MPEGIMGVWEGGLHSRLDAMNGERVCITVLDPISRERYMRFRGEVSGMTNSALSVDCWQAVPAFAEGAPVTLEVLSTGQMFRMHSTVQAYEPDRWSRMRLTVPAGLETVENRLHTRVEVRSPIWLVTEGQGQAVHGILRDISAGGAALRTEEPLSPGTQVYSALSLSTGLMFERLEAEVVRCSETGNGWYVLAVQFDYRPEKQALLDDYVKSRLANAWHII